MAKMDQHGITQGAHRACPTNGNAKTRARASTPTASSASINVDPNQGMDAVRELDARGAGARRQARAHCWGTGLIPQVPLNDKKMYPIYAKCVELDIPIFVYAGVPGAAHPFAPQNVGLLDEVCWFFPELKIITRHGGEPWTELMVKLLLKWPNLYYSTVAFAPKHYNHDIIDFANTRGADKIIYAGYYPMGLDIDRIFAELPNVPFRDHVWPKFLYENAARSARTCDAEGAPHGTARRHQGHRAAEHRAGAVRGHVALRPRRRGAARRPGEPTSRPGSTVAGGIVVAVLGDRPRPPQRRRRPEASRRRPRSCCGLCERADVLLEGFRPGVAERLGVGPDAVPGPQPAPGLRAA